MVSLRDAVNSLFHESFVRPTGALLGGGAGTLPLDVVETENEFVVKASLPGLKPEDIHTSIVGDTLTIRGETKSEEEKKGHTWLMRERRIGSFQRSLTLNARINADKANANFEDGVLTLTLPKAEAAKPKQIKISAK
jgi:HSP20 family protein